MNSVFLGLDIWTLLQVLIAIPAAAVAVGLLVHQAFVRHFRTLSEVERAEELRAEQLRNRRVKKKKRDLLPPAVVKALNFVLPSSVDSEDQARDTLARSGVKMGASTLWAIRIVSVALGLVAGIGVGLLMADAARMAGCVVIGAVAGVAAPQLYLLRRRAVWHEQIERDLPGALDLLTIAVSAGSTPESGMRTVATRTTGPLAELFSDAVAELRYGTRAAALKHMAAKAQVQPLTVFVASFVQAEQTGAPIAAILKSQADSVRKYRRMKLEAQINKLSVKMIFPIVAFIMPSLFLVVLAPAFARFMAMM